MTRAPGSRPRPLGVGRRLRAAFGPASAFGELLRFAAVGLFTAAIDFVVYNGALAVLGTHTTPALLASSTLAFFVQMLTSYVGNRSFTFRNRGAEGRRFLPYAAVSLSGFFIENATLYLIWQVLGAAGANHGFLAANLARAAAAVPTLVWTFLLYRSVVFVPAGTASLPASTGLRLPSGVHRFLYEQPLIPLGGLLAVGIALRLPFLLSLPLSAAEWQAAHVASLSTAAGPGYLIHHSLSLMSVLLSVLFRVTGPSFSVPRVLAVTLSAASVASTFFLGRQLWRSTLSGLIAALAVAANGPAILASHEAVSAVAAPLLVCTAAYALLRGMDGHPRLLVLSGALWLLSLTAGPWPAALLPGVALVLAGGLAAAPVARRAQVAHLASALSVLLAVAWILLMHPVFPGHLFSGAAALVRTAGDLTLLPAAVQPALGAAVLGALVATLAYGLRSRRGRLIAIPLLAALVGGPFLVPPAMGAAVSLMPLFAVLSAGAARWAARRLARRVPAAMYAAVAALTAGVIGFGPLLGLGAHDGRLLRADRLASPSPQIVQALGRLGATPARHGVVLLDSRGYRAGVVGWVLELHGYRVRFIGNAYAAASGTAGTGAALAHAFLDPAGPATGATYVVTGADYALLRRSSPTAGVVDSAASRIVGGYVVGKIDPTQPPPAAYGGVIVWGPGEGPSGTTPGAGPNG